jgi:hypothetical protein
MHHLSHLRQTQRSGRGMPRPTKPWAAGRNFESPQKHEILSPRSQHRGSVLLSPCGTKGLVSRHDRSRYAEILQLAVRLRAQYSDMVNRAYAVRVQHPVICAMGR